MKKHIFRRPRRSVYRSSENGLQIFAHQFALDLDVFVQLQYGGTQRLVVVQAVERNGVERGVQFQKAQPRLMCKFFGTAQQSCTQAVIMDEGMDIKRVQLGFFEVHLEKTLYGPPVFHHPKGFAGIGNGFEVAVYIEQGFPRMQYFIVVTADAGILDGVQMGIVYGLAVLRDCGTEYGQKAHGKMCCKMYCNACSDDVFFINRQGVV